MPVLPRNQLILLLAIALPGFIPHLSPAQNQVHLGASSNWDYGISMPEGTRFQPFASGQISSLSFDFHLGIPLGPFRLTPTFSTSYPLRTLLLTNPDGQDVPLGYSLSVPYTTGQDFSYYLFSDDHQSSTSYADIYQNLYGAYLTLDLGGTYDHVQIGSGLFLRRKKAEVYTPIVYDEYEWYNSTGTEWDHYYYTDTWSTGTSELRTYLEKTLAVPLYIDFCHHWGFIYSGFSFVYFLNRDPWMSFRYSMGVAF